MYLRLRYHVDELPGNKMNGRQSGSCPNILVHAIGVVDTQHSPTGTWASGVTGNSLTMRLGATPAFLKWPSICLVTFFGDLSEAATCTAWYSDWSARTVRTFAVT